MSVSYGIIGFVLRLIVRCLDGVVIGVVAVVALTVPPSQGAAHNPNAAVSDHPVVSLTFR